MKKKKFNQIWCNQTKFGEKFGMTPVAIGKILIAAGLKDPVTGEATNKALDEEFAKATPLKTGVPYFMWNKEKVTALISKEHTPLDKIDYWSKKVEKTLKDANKLIDAGDDKLGYMLADMAYDDVPTHLLEKVKEKINAENDQK